MGKSRTVVGFDSEDDGKGNPFLFCFVHPKGRAHFSSRHDALSWIERFAADCKAAGSKAEIWATNLEYDLCNLFPAERLAEVNFRFGRSALCGASWRGAEFRDTMRHVPASVSDLGEMVGLPKVERDLFDPGEVRTVERYLKRCQRDATITYRAAKMLSETFQGFGSHARMTLASTALSIWRDRFWKRPIYRPRHEIWQAASQAYHGGRTEAFAVGTFDDVTAVDVASMYPWAMTVKPLPLPWGLYQRHGAVAPERIQAFGLYDVEVESALEVPRLPVRTEQGTIFPNGRWRAWYVGEELQAFMAAGGRVRSVHKGFVFNEACEPFGGYVSEMFQKKSASRGVERSIYKLLANSLYGKFSQKGLITRAITVEKFLRMDPRPAGSRAWNGLIIYSQDGTPPPWSNMVWPAFVTARARVRLANEIQAIREAGGRVFYCDTDSVIFSGACSYPQKAKRIGEFELRGRYARLLLVGKKEYALAVGRNKWEAHVKGVPEAERLRFLMTGEASFSRPTRLRESARIGTVPNIWREVRKQRRTILRSHLPNGSLPSPILGDGEVMGMQEGEE